MASGWRSVSLLFGGNSNERHYIKHIVYEYRKQQKNQTACPALVWMTVLSYISDPNDYINWKIAVVANIESIIGIIGYPLLQPYTLHAKYSS